MYEERPHIINKAIVDIRLRPWCAIAPLTLGYIYFLNLSLMNAELTSLSCVHASKSIRFSTKIHHYFTLQCE